MVDLDVRTDRTEDGIAPTLLANVTDNIRHLPIVRQQVVFLGSLSLVDATLNFLSLGVSIVQSALHLVQIVDEVCLLVFKSLEGRYTFGDGRFCPAEPVLESRNFVENGLVLCLHVAFEFLALVGDSPVELLDSLTQAIQRSADSAFMILVSERLSAILADAAAVSTGRTFWSNAFCLS